MVILNKLVDVIAINNYMLNSHKCILLIYVRQFCLGKLPLLISVHLKIPALFVVSDFFSAEVSPKIMEVKIKQGFRTQKKCLFPLNRGHWSL